MCVILSCSPSAENTPTYCPVGDLITPCSDHLGKRPKVAVQHKEHVYRVSFENVQQGQPN